MKCHSVMIEQSKPTGREKDKYHLQDYIFMLFKLILLHKNLNSCVDMADGERIVRSAKYELPLYNHTNKVKYLIGSVHITALTLGILPDDQKECLVAKEEKNHNMSFE